MSRAHLSAEIPADATPEERAAIVAEAYRTMLSTASADPDIRLRMILGEASRLYDELARWIRTEIEKDEAKATGIAAFSDRLVRRNQTLIWLMSGANAPSDVMLTQARLLGKAFSDG